MAGGGLAGLVCAWRAARSGASVLVVDAPERPAAARVAAGMIAPIGEASWGEEDLLRAGLWAADAWPGFAPELEREAGSPVPYRRCGSLHVALDRDEAAELARQSEFEQRLGLESRRLLGSECRELEPGLSSAVNAGVEAPGEAEIDPRALLAALRDAGEQRASAACRARSSRSTRAAAGSGSPTAARSPASGSS